MLLGCAGSAEPAAATDARPAADSATVAIETSSPPDSDGDSEAAIEDSAPEDVAPSCMNGTRDGDETDVDCGGALCPKCAAGRTCGGAADCASASCSTEGVCACTQLDHCPDGTSCVAKLCVAAAASCAATKTAHPTAPDGEYWIKPDMGAPYRAYCDMAQAKEICTEAGGPVSSRTREGSNLAWSAVAKLDHKMGLCALHALKGATYPFADLKAVAGQTMKTCAAFGFKGDGTLGSCPYGTATGRTKCGFTVSALNRYGNACTGCTLNAGNFRNYLVQGPITAGAVLTDFTGTVKTTCLVR